MKVVLKTQAGVCTVSGGSVRNLLLITVDNQESDLG